jgi:putative transposase
LPMGRPLRWLQPGTTWFVTSRCLQARFLLRPDHKLTALVGYWLARAARRCAQVQVHGAVALSNHFHLIVTDPASELSAFMEYFLANVAKAINHLRRRSGPVFERRFSAEPILDPAALGERMAYLVLNPVRAHLVERHQDWPGLCLWTPEDNVAVHPFRIFDRERYERARRLAQVRGERVSPLDFYEEERLTVVPLSAAVPVEQRARASLLLRGVVLLAEIRREEGRLQEERLRGRRRVLGAAAAQCQDPEGAPAQAKRSPRPLCHASFREAWDGFRVLGGAILRGGIGGVPSGAVDDRVSSVSAPPSGSDRHRDRGGSSIVIGSVAS